VNAARTTDVLTFVIPVRDHRGVADWPAARARLGTTVRSVVAQTTGNWRCVLVASTDTPLPPLPTSVVVRRISLPYTELADRDSDLDRRLDQIRTDKGLRVLAGAQEADPDGYLMVVDYDDLVSRRLAEHVAAHAGVPGWYVDEGVAWDGGHLGVRIPRGFAGECGTSLIAQTRLWTWPEPLDATTEDTVRRRLGSHIRLAPDLAEAGMPLRPLPFPGAAYRVGYSDATSTPLGVRARWLSFQLLRREPRTWLVNASHLRVLTRRHLRERFGVGAGAGFDVGG
jgi:hypothetical protein